MDIIVWKDDEDHVVALTPPGGMTTSDALVSDLVPHDRPKFVIDHLRLPAGDILSWVMDDNGVVTAGPPREVVPTTASAGDFMRALYDLGWYEEAKAAVANAGDLAQILWDRAATFERNHVLVMQIALMIDKGPEDLDRLFVQAASYR